MANSVISVGLNTFSPRETVKVVPFHEQLEQVWRLLKDAPERATALAQAFHELADESRNLATEFCSLTEMQAEMVALMEQGHE